MTKTLVLSDVSGSTAAPRRRPMEVSIALELLVSALALDEYKDLVLTFETTPRFHHVVGDSLFQRACSLGAARLTLQQRSAPSSHSQRSSNCAQIRCPTASSSFRVCSSTWRTGTFESNYQVLKREFASAGYAVPHLAFWNANGNTSDVPSALSSEARVSLVSGFSTATLKAVLSGVEVTPLETVLGAILDPRYDAITLPDPTTTAVVAAGSGMEGGHDDGMLV